MAEIFNSQARNTAWAVPTLRNFVVNVLWL